MIIQIDKGHAIDGVRGAKDILDEVNENRKIGDRLIEMLREKGHTVYDVSCDISDSVNGQLQAIVTKSKSMYADLFISIHLNAGGGHGTETYTFSSSGVARDFATKINPEVVNSCGFRNRGLKTANFYVLRETICPAVLVEVCFVDSQEDVTKLNTEAVAKALFKGITGQEYVINPPTTENEIFYRVVVGAYKNRESAEQCLIKAKELGFKDAFLTKYQK